MMEGRMDMTKDENRNFIVKSESLVKPKDVTAISFLGDFNRHLPLKVQEAMVRKGSAKVPYMGFIVDPYGFFASFRIQDRAAAQALLPDGYDLADASIFKNGEKQPLVIASAFLARTSAFMGMRLEWYLIARHRETGLMSWIIADYETNTTSHDPKNGFCGYSSEHALHTTTPYGELLVEVQGSGGGREFAASADLTAGAMAELYEELWVNGNLSVDYGGALKTAATSPFSLIFDPALMKEALQIPPDRASIRTNTFLNELIDPLRPECVAVFPYSQHFVIRQDLQGRRIAGKEELSLQTRTFLERTGLKSMSGDDLKKPLFRGMLVSFLVNLGIIIFLLIKALT
jgi:hypothetical protein